MIRFPKRSLRGVFTVLACGSLLAAPLSTSAADPFEINAILPVTGAGAFLGKEESEALGLIETITNKSGGIGGRPIKFVIQDDQSNPQVAVQLTNGVLAKNVGVVLGSSLVSNCNAMVPLMKNQTAMYCFSPGIHPPDGSFAFSSNISTDDLMLGSARYLSLRGLKKIALIASTDATGQDAERGIDAAFGEKGPYGTTIVAREHFNPSDLSVTAQMTRIKASGAQAVMAWTTGTAAATLLRGVSDVGLTIPIVTSEGNLTYAQMKAYAGFMPKELLFPAPPAAALDQLSQGPVRNAVQAYVDAFKAGGVRPDIGQCLAWDPAMLVVTALKKLGTNATGDQIRSTIASLKGYVGVNGEYDFKAVPQRGIGVDAVVMVRWDAGKDAWVGVSKLGGAPLK
jgi:branched-chain amino acid transport system substrate-binding protein